MKDEAKGHMDNKKELTREEMITAIMADILKHDPEHLGRIGEQQSAFCSATSPKKSLEYIENNMRKKDISDLRDDYYFYFPKEKENTLNNEIEGEPPSIIYKRHSNPSRTAVNESFVQRYDKVSGTEIKPGAIVFWGTAADCNTITNKLNSGDISENDVCVLRDLSDYAEYHGMIANRMYPPLKAPLYDINQVTIELCYKMGISAVPYTTLNNQNWNEALQNPEKTAKNLHLNQSQLACIEKYLNEQYPEYFPKAEMYNQGMEEFKMENDFPKNEYSKEEIKQAESVDIKGYLTASYPDQVTIKGNQLLFKNAKEETVSINISDGDKNGLFFNTATQNSGKGIINFLRQETGTSFKNAVGALLEFSQNQVAEPEQSEQEKAAIAFHKERRLNVECGKAIDQAVRDTYTQGEMAGTGYYNNEAAVKSVIDKYGIDRVALVLASNINAYDHDGRISSANKAWAKGANVPDKPDFYLEMHRTILDSFANKFRAVAQAAHEKSAQAEQKDFVPPKKSETVQNVENYLTGKMSFDKGIVKSCIEQGSIYQTEVYSEKLDKNIPCAVFAGFDANGTMQSASIKGFGSYESVQLGSQLKHAFVLTAKEKAGKQATAVSVFDTPLETLAGATLAKMKDKTNYANIHRLSVVKTWLFSTHAKALRTFLESKPQITTVNLCLPNTDDGRKIAETLQTMLKELGKQRGEAIKVNDLIPKESKNLQEQLQNKIGEIKENRKANEGRE